MSKAAFIGRRGELEILTESYDSPRGEIAVIYGRRRVGKTALIEHFCRDKRVLSYTAVQWPDEALLEEFSQRVEAFSGVKGLHFRQWTDAIEFVSNLKPEERTVIVLEEFQYLAQSRPGILSELQAFYDAVLQHKNVLLILCGSSVSFFSKEVLGEKNPLYGRARTLLKVGPMPFTDIAQLLPGYDAEDKFRTYAVLGGIPYYWTFFREDRSFEANLAAGILRRGSFLNEEPQRTLAVEFREPTRYSYILNSIANGASAYNEIARKSLVEARLLGRYLSILQTMDLVVRELPVLPKSSDKGTVSRGLYKLSDNYLRFWFRFLGGNPGRAATLAAAERMAENQVLPAFSKFAAPAFEEVCRQYLQKLIDLGKLPFPAVCLGRWWHRDTEIDIVATDAKRQNWALAECKYTSQKIGLNTLSLLDAKRAALGVADNAVVHRWLFSRSGFEDKLCKMAELDDTLHLVALEELVSPKS